MVEYYFVNKFGHGNKDATEDETAILKSNPKIRSLTCLKQLLMKFKQQKCPQVVNQKLTSKPEEAKTVTKTPLKASDLKVAVEEEKKVET